MALWRSTRKSSPIYAHMGADEMGLLSSLFGNQQPVQQPPTALSPNTPTVQQIDTAANPGHGLLFGNYRDPAQEMAQLALFSQLASGQTVQDQMNFAPTLIPMQQAMAAKQQAADTKNKTVAMLQQKAPELATAVASGALSPADALAQMFKQEADAKNAAKYQFMNVNGHLVRTNAVAGDTSEVGNFTDPNAALTPDIKNYNQAVKDGFTGSFTDYQQTIKNGGNTKTNLQKDLEAAGIKPNTPEYNKAIMNAHKLSADPNSGNLKNDLETMKAYRGEDPIKTYQVVHGAYQKALASANLGTSAGDMSLIYAFMKMNDPTSVVREGEFATAANTGGIDDKIINIYNRVRDGQMLTPDQRVQFIQAAQSQYDAASKNVQDVNTRYKQFSKDYNVNPDRFMIQPEQFQTGQTPGATNNPVDVTLPSGKKATIQRMD